VKSSRRVKLLPILESHYRQYNKKRYITPDPLELVYEFENPADREVAGLIASSFALGRVKSIVDTGRYVLQTLKDPARVLRDSSARDIRRRFTGFKYRFFSENDIAELLLAIGAVLRRFGSLENCFLEHIDPSSETTLPALTRFVQSIYDEAGAPLKMLPDPRRGSACKRLHLFLRWMIRHDAVDPGVWTGISPSVLIVPMDVHMHRISREFDMTGRKQADAKTALEVTGFFKSLRPDDPVRYDFCLTRVGIHPELQNFVF
jgi:uncharacterized protein (TIGR02757 family)